MSSGLYLSNRNALTHAGFSGSARVGVGAGLDCTLWEEVLEGAGWRPAPSSCRVDLQGGANRGLMSMDGGPCGCARGGGRAGAEWHWPRGDNMGDPTAMLIGSLLHRALRLGTILW